ncbi:MAG TPA: transglutaminase-like cysteine peptidase [Pseudolabrys sp.]|nr:transglutaminase-like cysteine peptidase [Pseudolabrys sp.]
MRSTLLLRARNDAFYGMLAAYLCAPLAAAFFVLVCTWSPLPYPYFENLYVDIAQANVSPAANRTDIEHAGDAVVEKADGAGRNNDERLILAAHHNEPFKQTSYLAPDGLLWTKWLPVESAIETEMRTIAGCQDKPQTCPTGAATAFNSILNEALKHEGRARLGIVNRATNLAIRYTSDSQQYGINDYWATPFQTFASGKGDCEDYAIAKHAILRAANWPASDLRIVVLWDSLLRDFHAIEAARHEGVWWILDNRTMSLVADVNLAHYHPIFIIDDVSVRQLHRPSPVDGFRISDRLLTNAGGEISLRGLCSDRSLAWQLVHMLSTDWLSGWAAAGGY